MRLTALWEGFWAEQDQPGGMTNMTCKFFKAAVVEEPGGYECVLLAHVGAVAHNWRGTPGEMLGGTTPT